MLFPLAILLSCGSLIKRSNSSFISGSLIPESSFSDSRCQLTHVCPSNLSSLRYLKKRYTHLGQSPNLGYGQRTLPRSFWISRSSHHPPRQSPSADRLGTSRNLCMWSNIFCFLEGPCIITVTGYQQTTIRMSF